MADLATANREHGFKEGHIPWNKGIPRTFETRKKISQKTKGRVAWNVGITHTETSRAKIRAKRATQVFGEQTKKLWSQNRKGSGNPNWKGGTTSEGSLIRQSDEYKTWHTQVLRRDDYRCQSCKQKGGKLHVDHELSFALYPDLRLEILNGRVLCVSCHKKTPTYLKSSRNSNLENLYV